MTNLKPVLYPCYACEHRDTPDDEEPCCGCVVCGGDEERFEVVEVNNG